MVISEKIKRGAKGVTRLGAAHARELSGAESRFCIRGAYAHRTEAIHWDDTGFTEEYQKEVYLRARNENVKTIYDIGCGSGYKLITFLGKYDTTGFEVPANFRVTTSDLP
jgi:hypothetical protein